MRQYYKFHKYVVQLSLHDGEYNATLSWNDNACCVGDALKLAAERVGLLAYDSAGDQRCRMQRAYENFCRNLFMNSDIDRRNARKNLNRVYNNKNIEIEVEYIQEDKKVVYDLVKEIRKKKVIEK